MATTKKTKIELLSPAGDLERLKITLLYIPLTHHKIFQTSRTENKHLTKIFHSNLPYPENPKKIRHFLHYPDQTLKNTLTIKLI